MLVLARIELIFTSILFCYLWAGTRFWICAGSSRGMQWALMSSAYSQGLLCSSHCPTSKEVGVAQWVEPH